MLEDVGDGRLNQPAEERFLHKPYGEAFQNEQPYEVGAGDFGGAAYERRIRKVRKNYEYARDTPQKLFRQKPEFRREHAFRAEQHYDRGKHSARNEPQNYVFQHPVESFVSRKFYVDVVCRNHKRGGGYYKRKRNYFLVIVFKFTH